MPSMAVRGIDGLKRHRRLILAVLVAVTLPFAWGANRTRISNSLEGWFVQGDPSLRKYREFQERFGNDEAIVVAIHAPDGVFQRETLEAVKDLTRDLEPISHIRSVLSLLTVPVMENAGGRPGFQELGNKFPFDATPPERIREELRREDFSWKSLVSSDERTTLLYVLQKTFSSDEERTEVIRKVRERLAETKLETHVAGTGIVFDAINEASTEDLSWILSFAGGVCVLLMFLALRRALHVLLALLSAAVAAIWTVGVFGFTNTPLNMVTTMVPTIVAVLAMANSIHLLRAGESAIKACFFSMLTSAASFLALQVSDIGVLRELGVFCCIGIVISFFAALVICIPWRRKGEFPAREGPLKRFGEVVVAHRGLVSLLFVPLLAAGAFGLGRLRVDTYSIGFLPKDHPVRTDSDWIESHFGPYVPIEFEVYGEPGSFAKPDLFRRIRDFQLALEADPALEGLCALPDLFATVPGSEKEIRATVDVMRVTLGEAAMERFVSDDFHRIQMRGRTLMASASGFNEVLETGLAGGQEIFREEATVQAVGYLPVYVRLTRYLGSSLLKSLPLVIGVNFILLAFLFRSILWALLATIANMFPIYLLLGAMGFLNVPLDVASVSIACVGFGILVDDTIHLLLYAREGIKSGLPAREAVAQSLNTGGTSITWTTVVLVGGFVTFLSGSVAPVYLFGVLLACTLALGYVLDVLLIPVFVVAFRKFLGAKS